MCCLCVGVVYQCGGEERSLRQYWYTSWPDQKTPDKAPPLLELVQEVERAREEAPPSSGPTIVHCRYESFVCYVCCEGMSIFSSSNPRVSEVPTEDFTLTKLTNQYANPSIFSSSVPPPILPSFFSAVLELVGPAASSPPPSCASSWGLKVWLTSWEPPASSVWTGEVFLEYIRAHLYL